MDTSKPDSTLKKVRRVVIGRSRNPHDSRVFHHISLIAFFAWVGLGADGLSSSSYGPAEAFKTMGEYPYLAVFVAIASAITVLMISTSYSQIIELFPSGGGGYLVASKLLSPVLGMISGCALLLDYVLTIAISVAAGSQAIFSFMPELALYKPLGISLQFWLILLALLILTLMNLRGVKESVLPLVPIFLVFVITHAVVILSAVAQKFANLPALVSNTSRDMHGATSSLGIFGMLILLLKAYSMGAGTYTGIEAVSNGLPILREPHAVTGKRTMRYMAFSLAFMVLGLMLAYLLYGVANYQADPAIKAQVDSGHLSLNGVLFNNFTQGWGPRGSTGYTLGKVFVAITLFSEAAILFVAAQAGFLDGPRVLANMALDKWFPHRFATLSDRLVTQNGVLLMGGAALITLIAVFVCASGGNLVDILVVLYSINVFITFVLSQGGMAKYWWSVRRQVKAWKWKLLINGLSFVLCAFILVSTVVIKFHDGGWITVLITGALVGVVLLIHRHYQQTQKLLGRLNSLVRIVESAAPAPATVPIPAESGSAAPTPARPPPRYDPAAKTAVLMVNGFNGLGLHTLFSIVRLFGGVFRNYVIIHVGVVDSGNFKGVAEMDGLRAYTASEAKRYTDYLQREGYYAEAVTAVGIDVVDEVGKLATQVLAKYPNAVFFGGQLVFPQETFWTRLLHNNTVFSIQRRFYAQGVPVVVLPIRV